ncbi:uncharacterized protein KGF55_004789 [Candida pseudojiufengensis]|uniref:uncharacterized protein n=1 Tax=Candida pseudojiufengensis TaxID=497109 RepID=UPI00222586B1|nr:uncharacterized protein KGF55_004789 [Candida pseudojiufengensis]KAI5960066.1 hypothetical protein KGF55_004789 [Candida pseudojiufengensis]
MFKRFKSRTHSNSLNSTKDDSNNNLRPSRSDHQNEDRYRIQSNNNSQSPFSRFQRRFSQPNSTAVATQPRDYSFQTLHHGEQDNESAIDDEDDVISPLNTTDADHQSVTLSEAPTLTVDRSQRMELQNTFIDNFTEYLPFVVRRMRAVEERRRQNQEHNENQDHLNDYDFDGDDMSTMYNEQHIPSEQYALDHIKIMERNISVYNFKRQLVIMNGMLKHNTYVFPSIDSYKLFKELRSGIKKERKNSVILYDSKGGIRKASSDASINKTEFQPHGKDIIDNRNHIIPIDYKIKGQGLPLFKINIPYMSSFRKNSPYIIFKKFKEIPSPPTSTTEEDTEFETFNYCFVYSKFSSNYRRFIFEFNPGTSQVFKIILFQSNFKPFCDFIYKDTRFRILGTTVASGLICQYNPHMRLLIIDEGQPSFCDNIINKPPSSFLKFGKKDDDESSNIKFNINDPSTFINPIPENSFIQEENTYQGNSSYNYIPSDLPPFGCFKDASIIKNSNSSSFLPKKYNDAGRIDLYQDLTNNNLDINSTLSVDQDTLVLTVILSTMREINLRNAAKSSGNSMLNGPGSSGPMRLGAFGLATTGLSAI